MSEKASCRFCNYYVVAPNFPSAIAQLAIHVKTVHGEKLINREHYSKIVHVDFTRRSPK